MKKLTEKEIQSLIDEYKDKDYTKFREEIIDTLSKKITSYSETKAVLGIDIYRYSQYPILEQSLIPYLFKMMYDQTINFCLSSEQFIFQNRNRDDFTEYFIDTGDGGFQIFDTPFQAIIFAIYLQSFSRHYNSGKTILRQIIGEITLRYCLTYDDINCFEKNYYGPSIINNARIISKDKLNRFLLDQKSINWFTEEINGIENMQAILLQDLKAINSFKEYKMDENNKKLTLLFKSQHILKADLQNIGEIKLKFGSLPIYSLHMQVLLHTSFGSLKKYTISIGNLNSTGVGD